MRPWLLTLAGILALSAQALALEPGREAEAEVAAGAKPQAEAEAGVEPLGALRLDSQATRYGTAYETVYLLNLEPSAQLRLGAFEGSSLELTARMPLSTSGTYPTYCCRTALGNATLAAALRNAGGPLRHWYEASISLPSSRWSNPHASSLAATAALLHDAGYYLPNTTTLRAGLGAEFALTPWLELGASTAAHYWLQHDEEASPLLVPLAATVAARWAPPWSARLGYRGLARLLDPLAADERFLSELSAAIAYAWTDSRLELAVFLPLDESLRELGMLSVGTSYSRSF